MLINPALASNARVWVHKSVVMLAFLLMASVTVVAMSGVVTPVIRVVNEFTACHDKSEHEQYCDH